MWQRLKIERKSRSIETVNIEVCSDSFESSIYYESALV